MMRKLLFVSTILLLSLFLSQTHLFAAGGGGGSDRYKNSKKVESAAFKNGRKAIQAKDFSAAIPFLLKAAEETPDDADVHNLLGYSYRKLGNFEQSFNYYNQALSLNPKHRGANEYIGELYLQTDNLEGAEKHLEILDDACFFGCEEYDELKEAIAKYKAKKGGG